MGPSFEPESKQQLTGWNQWKIW